MPRGTVAVRFENTPIVLVSEQVLRALGRVWDNRRRSARHLSPLRRGRRRNQALRAPNIKHVCHSTGTTPAVKTSKSACTPSWLSNARDSAQLTPGQACPVSQQQLVSAALDPAWPRKSRASSGQQHSRAGEAPPLGHMRDCSDAEAAWQQPNSWQCAASELSKTKNLKSFRFIAAH